MHLVKYEKQFLSVEFGRDLFTFALAVILLLAENNV